VFYYLHIKINFEASDIISGIFSEEKIERNIRFGLVGIGLGENSINKSQKFFFW